MLRRLFGIYERRLIALRDALNHYRPLSIAIPAVTGGTSYWVRGPAGLDSERLRAAAQDAGVLIEPATPYFADGEGRSNMFRLGVTSLGEERIRPGIEALSRVMRQLVAGELPDAEEAPVEAGAVLPESGLRRHLAGARLNYRTVYGEPCIIDLLPDGRMIGKAGYAQEDRDEGRWWIEGDHWCRQWSNWAYGETSRFRIEKQGKRIFWIDAEGRRVDRAILAPAAKDDTQLAP